MQIMPTQYSESLDNPYFGTSTSTYDDSNSFAEEMYRQQEARDAVDSGESHSVEVALEPLSNSEPLTQAPYSLSSNDGVTYTAEEVFFTKKELSDLLSELQNKGVAEENLEELKKLAGQPDGATLHQVLSSFYNTRNYANLDDTDLATIKGIASRIDASGNLSNTLLSNVNGANGKDGQKFLSDLVASLDNLPEGARLTLSKQDVSILAKAAGLSDETTAKLLGSFGPYDSLQFNKSELSNFLAPAFNDFTNENKNLAKLDKALDETLGPILNAARARMQKEEEAYALSIRSSEQSKLLIQETVLANVNKNLEAARQAQSGAAHNEAMQAQVVAEAKTAAKNFDSKQTRASVDDAARNQGAFLEQKFNAEAKLENNMADMQDRSKSDGKANDRAESLFGKAHKNNQDSNLNSVLNKADVQSMPNVPSNNTTTPVMSIGGLVSDSSALAQAQQSANTDLLSHQAANQVEKAMLLAAKDGTKRLDLQLHPMELGAVTITLTSRNGELNALIRSEKPETTELMHKQLEHIRAALEQQGLKVDKLEVQTQTPENNAQYEQWDGMQEHNARQEENARRDVFERLRNLGKVRNNGTILDETTLEHSMHLDNHTARVAGQPLHIVA